MKRECIDKLAKLLDEEGGALYQKEGESGGVLGFLTPEEVAKRFEYCHKYNTDIYHEEKELTAKNYYEGLIERWRERIDEINAHADPESQSRAEWDVLEEVIFEVSLGFPLLK